MPGRKARVMITLACPRQCDGCCNTGPVFDEHKIISDISEVYGFDEIMLTGGEPMLYPHKTLELVQRIKKENRSSELFLYSALFNPLHYDVWHELLITLDGMQFTLHHECTEADVRGLRQLSRMVKHHDYRAWSSRLSIDKRLYDRYDFSNIDFTGWGSVRKLVWLPDCPLPEGEELFLLKEG